MYQDERKRHHEDLEQCRMETEMQEMAIKQLEASIADKVLELYTLQYVYMTHQYVSCTCTQCKINYYNNFPI